MRGDWEDWLMWGIFGFFGCIFALIGFGIYSDMTAEKIEITKSEWSCTATRKETVLMPIGKVLVPQSSERCVKYERDGETQ